MTQKINSSLLIVDDEELILEVLSASLGQEGLRIDQANNGKNALEMIKQNTYHAILSDIHMPQKTGLELLKEIRDLGIITPFIVLTGFGDQQKAVEALKLGAFDFIDKPWDEPYLQDVVGRALELGTHLERFAQSPDDIASLLEVHFENNRSSLAYLAKHLNLQGKS
ncbi:MAG: response regulator [Bdellovibrionia bacterium]